MALTKLSDYTKTNIILDKAVNIEGGYVDNPNDRGGATNFGITQATALRYKNDLVSKFQWNGNMKDLTVSMAVYIYDQDYWTPMGLDSILREAPLLADLLFEAGINFNYLRVAEWFQTCLNVLNLEQTYTQDIPIDGHIGPMTISAFQSILNARPIDGMKNLLFMVSSQASACYVTLALNRSKDETFESGWQNRVRLQYGVYLGILGLT